MFFQGNCYFFSKTQWNWRDSVTACQEVGAQLVIIKGAEEQVNLVECLPDLVHASRQ
jgi:CD209 antigen